MVLFLFIQNSGYQCEQHDNPADFILDVINGDIDPHVHLGSRKFMIIHLYHIMAVMIRDQYYEVSLSHHIYRSNICCRAKYFTHVIFNKQQW